MMNLINGYKTYGVALLIVAVVAAGHFGFIDPQEAQAAIAALVGVGLATLRHGVKKGD